MQVTTKDSVEKSAYAVIRGLLKAEGVSGLYRVFGTVITGAVPARVIFMTALETTKVAAFKIVEPFQLSEPTKAAIANGIAGMTASLCSQGVFVPINVISQRLMVQGYSGHASYNGGLDVARKVLKQDGIRGLYRGFGLSVMTYSPSSAVWWASYGSSQRVIWSLLGHGNDGNGYVPSQGTIVLVQGAGGISAASAAALITTLLDTIETRLQERQQKLAEEQRNLVQQQSQAKAQLLRYEDELARKRMQTDHEAQRQHNAELARMQEESLIRKEQARRATEEQIQAQQRQTEKERAEIERETIRVKAMAEAEGRAHEAKLTEDHNRRMLIERVNGEKEKWLAAINTTFSHIEGGVRMLLTDRSKLVMTVGGVTALAAGVYTTREGARVMWGYVNRILGQPSLIRESSMAKFPWSGIVTQGTQKLSNLGKSASVETKHKFGNIILHPSLQRRIEHIARATANTKSHQAPFRNMLFYGPPGTGKTLVAREIARKSGLDYAMMTGGDVAPLGAQAVTKIHEIFDWSKKSKRGLLLFIDEADAFLCERNSTHMSEAQRSALNALLFRTGDQSRDVVLVLATNRPGDLDSAITDRIDDVIEFPLPQEEERFKLLKLYLHKYLYEEDDQKKSKWHSLFAKKTQKIVVKDLSDDVIREAAKKTEGFSGREIAKLIASVQAAVYGRPDCSLDSQLFLEIVDYKVGEHHQRIELANAGSQLA